MLYGLYLSLIPGLPFLVFRKGDRPVLEIKVPCERQR